MCHLHFSSTTTSAESSSTSSIAQVRETMNHDRGKPDGVTRSTGSKDRASRTLGMIIAAFVLSWAPFFIMYPTIGFLPEVLKPGPEVFLLVLTIGFSNSAMNPIIYGFMNPKFRAGFKTIFNLNTLLYVNILQSSIFVHNFALNFIIHYFNKQETLRNSRLFMEQYNEH